MTADTSTGTRRVVVTGMGLVTPHGNDVKLVWDSILAGNSGISKNPNIPEQCPVQIGGVLDDFAVENFDLARDIRQKLKKLDKFVSYAAVAAKFALRDAALEQVDEAESDTFGVAIGSGIGGITSIQEQCKRYHDSDFKRVSPFLIPASISNMASGVVSMLYR